MERRRAECDERIVSVRGECVGVKRLGCRRC